MNSLHRRGGKSILPDPSLDTEQKMSAPGILNLPQQLTYSKGIFMHTVLVNNSPNYLAHDSLLVTSPTTPAPGITSMCQAAAKAKACLKLAYPSWTERPSGINSLPQNIKSCISFPCFKRNLLVSENNPFRH